MKFVEGGYVIGGEQGVSLDRLHGSDCIYACMTKEQAKILGFNIGDGMSEISTRKLVIGLAQPGDRLVLCDKETGQPLEGQTDLKINSPSDGRPTVIVTFDVWGAHGIRFMGEAEKEQ